MSWKIERDLSQKSFPVVGLCSLKELVRRRKVEGGRRKVAASWFTGWFRFLTGATSLGIYFAASVLFLSSCSDLENRNIPDVSDIPVQVELRRFEQDLFAIDTNNISPGLAQLQEKYPAFSELYFNEVLGADDPRYAPDGPEAFISGFLKHPPLRALYDTCMIVYGEFDDLEADFARAFQFYLYYFPDRETPDLTTFISEYTIGNFIYNEQSLAIGLDFFLGADYPYQRYNPGNPNFSNYLVRTFNKDHLVMKTLLPLVQDLTGEARGGRLLDMMVHNGKQLYIMDHLLPYAPDSVKLEMTSGQVQWLEDNEQEIWAFLLKEELLYSSRWQEIRKYVDYSPNSPGMPPEAPGRTANWIGWQIVKKYMETFPETTMAELIELRDAQRILDDSRYKPRR